MAMLQQNTNLTPSLSDGNLAQRIMAQPAANIDGSSVPAWTQFYKHILGIKSHIVNIGAEMNVVYQNLVATGYDEGEPTILMNRFLEEMGKAIDRLNEISLRGNPGQTYMGPARTAQESQDIVLNSTEATEVYSAFLMTNTLTVQAMQEFHMHLTLKQRAQAQAQGAVVQPQ